MRYVHIILILSFFSIGDCSFIMNLILELKICIDFSNIRIDKINTVFVTTRNMVDNIVAGTVEMTRAVSSQCPEINSIEPEDEQNECVRQCATGLNKRDDLNTCTPHVYLMLGLGNCETFPSKTIRIYFSFMTYKKKYTLLFEIIHLS